MPEKIIEIKKLPSGTTAIVFETSTGVAIEIGAGTNFIDEKDMFDFTRLLQEVDKYFLKK